MHLLTLSDHQIAFVAFGNRINTRCRVSAHSGFFVYTCHFQKKTKIFLAVFLSLFSPFFLSFQIICLLQFNQDSRYKKKDAHRIIQYLTGLFFFLLADNGFRFAYKCWLYKHSRELLYSAVAATAVCSSLLIREPQTAVSFSPCPLHFKTN